MMKKFILVGRESNWLGSFAVEESAASFVVSLLNSTEDDGNWIAITVPLTVDEIQSTIDDWKNQGIK